MISSDALRPTSNPGRKALGKLAARLEEVKNPWRHVSTLELSHNEAARLATDALLESGNEEYRRVLSEERELNFLSSLEIRYITENAARAGLNAICPNGVDRDCGEGDTVSELTSGTYFPMMSDEEPPMLELGWPELPHRFGPSETQIFFQRDKSQNVKDMIRSLINKAKKVIALVMDVFSDVDLFCDLIEASNKRKVPVYILLDEKNLSHFMDMCDALDIQNSHLGNMRVRCVSGETYCTKSGKKFTGQVQEKFMIIDCEEVITGSYSFTWLSAQVHSNMLLLFSGRIVESFDREFRCMYADSEIVERFHNPDEDGLPYYSYNASVLPGLLAPGSGLDLLSERSGRVCSENSSSQSSSSVSSIKAAPGMSAAVYRVTQGKPDPTGTLKDRRGGLSSGLQTSGTGKGSPNGTPQGQTGERTPPGAAQSAGAEWAKAGTPEFLRVNLGGPTSKFQAMGLYDTHTHSHSHKTQLHGAAHTPPPTQAPLTPEPKLPLKQRSPPHTVLNKLTDLFTSTPKEKDFHIFKRSPPHSTAFGGPDLSQNEPESKQGLPYPVPLPADRSGGESRLTRQDNKRMTLGHSKLDLVNQYNKMKSKQVYSRFELKNNH